MLTNFNNRERLKLIEDINKNRENLVNFAQKFNSSMIDEIGKSLSVTDEIKKSLSMTDEIKKSLSKSVTGDINEKLNVAKALNKQSLDISEIVGVARTLNNINLSVDTKRMVSFIESLNQKGLLNMNKIVSLGESLDLSSEEFEKVNWRDFSLNDDMFKQVSGTLESESEEELEEDLKKVDFNKIADHTKNFVLFIYLVLDFISATASTANEVIDLAENYQEYKQQYIVESNESNVDDIDIDDSLKQIENKLRVVTKQDLVVREGKNKDSRIVGKLDVGNVVQILEKKKNWVYVSYVNRNNDEVSEVIEGWTLTRYVKRIK